MNILNLLIAFVEWYDVSICIAFSDILYQTFFPNTSKILGFQLALLMASISCLGKPIGAYIIGQYSDQTSRINASFIAFSIMIACSILTICIPSHQTFHYAGIFFLTLKFIQGIAIGGNYSASIYSLENSKQQYFINSLISFAIFSGFMIANLFYLICQNTFSTSFNFVYAWRIGFLISGIISIPVFYFIFTEQKKSIKTQQNIKKHAFPLKVFIKACILILLDTVPFQYFHIFLPNYKILILKQNEQIVKINVFITITTILILTPIFGKIADKYHNAKAQLTISSIMMIFGIFSDNIFSAFCSNIYFGIMMSLCYSTLYCYIPLEFHKDFRAKYSGLALHLTTSFIILYFQYLGSNLNIYIYKKFFIIIGILSIIMLHSKKQ